ELAAAVRQAISPVLAEQGTVTGTVPLTSPQHRFAEHGTWAGVLRLAPGIDPAALARAVQTLVAHHDALRMRLSHDPEQDTWVQHNAAREDAELFSVVDATGMDEAQAAERTARTPLNLADGPLIKVAYFDRGAEPGWLGVTVHHLVMDGVSWNVLLEDLDRAYRGEPLPPKTTSFQQWAEKLRSYAASDEVRAQLPYWERQLEGFAVPVDHVSETGEPGVVRVTLDAETTSALLTRANETYRTQVDDLLLAALLRTLTAWAGTGAVTIDVETHGREAVTEDVDLSRTVGWFASAFPVRLSAADPADPAGLLKSVKEQLRAVPGGGIGYGALRHLTGHLPQARDAEILFTDLGAPVTTGIVTGHLYGPAADRPYPLRIEVLRTPDGRMAFEWHYSTTRHRPETIERVANAHAQAVTELVSHCLSPEAGGYTPSDFPLAGLDQGTLDALVAGAGRIEDVYPLTPVQQGMLFHTLEAPEDASGVYWAQELREFTGRRLDADALREAWRIVVGRHPALRTSFAWEGVMEPLQIVHAELTVPFEVLDWSDTADGDEHQTRLEELLRADRDRGFDVTAAPLMRVYVIECGDERSWMVWTFHHICADGWSVSIVMDEVARAYESLRAQQEVALPAAPPYRDLIAWMAERDKREAEEFWRGYMAGFEAPTPLPVDRAVAEHWDSDYLIMEFSPEVTAGLERLARRARVTLGTVMQAGWALLLSRHSGESDVVFGLTVSGRPAELAGMESIVGLFINTLPVRATVPADTPFIDWLREMQDGQIALQRFEYTSLLDIQRYSPIPRGTSLFDSIVAFQNLPEEATAIEGQQELTAAEAEGFDALLMFEQGRYPLMFSVDLEDQMAVAVEFSTAAFDKATVERLFDQYRRVLGVVAADPDAKVRDVPLQSEQDLQRMLVGWNETATTEVPKATLPELFKIQARRHPGKCAVRCAGEELTYAELDRRAGQVAGMLRRHGVAVQDKVGLHFERGIDFIVALLGVAQAGAAYVPLDPAQPESRLRYMIENSGITTVVSNAPWPPELDTTGARVLGLPDADEPVAEEVAGDPDGLLYAMYTSGSTGVPKGVEVTHEAVARICFDPVVVVEPGDVVSHIVPISFDASTFEIWGALLNGATLAVASAREMEQLDFVSILRGNGVTVSVVTSGLFHQVAEAAPEVFAGLRMLLCGGDALSI
ncbi:condensation domain-containing protein, partial [Nonomuraea lactucae]|uniref:condensation domain-containing protein n=1 Tax=Nonomuraea lactucae TaxID=2249762 RepID=UPI0013B42599